MDIFLKNHLSKYIFSSFYLTWVHTPYSVILKLTHHFIEYAEAKCSSILCLHWNKTGWGRPWRRCDLIDVYIRTYPEIILSSTLPSSTASLPDTLAIRVPILLQILLHPQASFLEVVEGLRENFCTEILWQAIQKPTDRRCKQQDVKKWIWQVPSVPFRDTCFGREVWIWRYHKENPLFPKRMGKHRQRFGVKEKIVFFDI